MVYLNITEFERSFSTKIGSTFEECAKLIALDNHIYVERNHRVSGRISVEAIAFIEQTVNDIGSRQVHPDYLFLAKQTVSLAETGSEFEERERTADLFIETVTGMEIYFEIKSPKAKQGTVLGSNRENAYNTWYYTRTPSTG